MSRAPGRAIDCLSAPWVFGGAYFLMFGLGAIDAALDPLSMSPRLRDYFLAFHGLSAAPLAYLVAGFSLFLVGYYIPVGVQLADSLFVRLPVVARRRHFLGQGRSLGAIAVVSLGALAVLVTGLRRFGAGRLIGPETFEASFSYVYIAGEVSLIAYAAAMWQYMLSKRPGRRSASRFEALCVWCFLFAPQVMISLWLGSRMRLITVLLTAILARHYAHRQVTVRTAMVLVATLLIVVMPAIAWQRQAIEARALPDSVWSLLRWGWDSLMMHFSSLEGFTIVFEDPGNAPRPEPLWTIITSGLVPRFVWPEKPLSTYAEHFGLWATGFPSDAFFPTLPGELLLHFGYSGGLAAMAVLGLFWRVAFALLIRGGGLSCAGFIYVTVLARTVPGLEVGFVLPCAAILRNAVIAVGLYLLVTRTLGHVPSQSVSNQIANS